MPRWSRCALMLVLSAALLPAVAGAQEASDAAAPAAPPKLSTDKLDYAPGDTAQIRGAFFHAYEAVTVQVVHADETAEPGAGHEPWTVVTNGEGKFETTWYVEPETSLDKMFTVSAVCDHGLRVEMQFTDAIVTTTHVVNLHDSGWYRTDGFHNPANKNYFVGREFNGARLRDYFVFNLAGITGTVTSASLRAFNPCYSGGSNTYTLFDVTTPIPALMSSSGGTAAFNDLGTGTPYGSVFVSVPFTPGLTFINNNVFVSLNSAGLSAVQGRLGGLLAVGGDYPGGGIDFILGCSFGGFGSSAVQLTIQVQRTVADTAMDVDPATGTYGGTTTLRATLTSAGLGVGGKIVQFSRSGTLLGSRITNAMGVAELTGASLIGINAGSYPNAIVAQFAGDSDLGASTGSNTLVVERATPSINWPAPDPIVYGTLLGAAQLNATASVEGSFIYTPAAAAPLDAGPNQTLSTSFTPTDAQNYNAVVTSVAITVTKATPTVSATGGTFTFDGQPHPATGSVTGVGGIGLGGPALTYNGDPAPPVNAGTYAVVATFAGNTNYEPASNNSATIVIKKAVPAIGWNNPAGIVFGTPLGAAQLNAVVQVAGTLTYTPAAGTLLHAGSYTLSVSFVPDDPGNHTEASASVTLSVARAAPAISVTGGTFIYDAQAHPATGSVLGIGGVSIGAPALTYGGSAAAPVNAGTYAVLASFPGNDDYEPASNGSASIVINRAPPSILASGGTFLFDGNPHPATGIVTGVNGELLTPIAFTYNGSLDVPASAGIYIVVAAYGGSANYNPVFSSVVVVTILAPPAITSITGPSEPAPINASRTVDVLFDDAATNDTHTCKFTWGDGAQTSTNVAAGAGACSSSHVYPAAGVYTVSVVVTDDDGLTAESAYRYIVIYDAGAGFVTGGGWVQSAGGSYVADATVAGKGHFGFVSKYKKGMSVPTGETEFNFQVAGFSFKSTSYEWLVVSGSKAQYKGWGTVNGAGDYGFLLTATDGDAPDGNDADRFRIKIWDRLSGDVVYDNALGAADDISSADPQSIGAGSIVIHNK